MLIQELKSRIERKESIHDFMVFKCLGDIFTARQYYHQIALINNMDILTLDSMPTPYEDIFSISQSNNTLSVYICDEFDSSKDLRNISDLIVVCKKLSSKTSNQYQDHIIEFPKLEDWQVEDYVFSICPGVSKDKLKDLILACNKDIFKIDMELRKILPFDEIDRETILANGIAWDSISTKRNQNVFDFSNAIVKRDIKTLSKLEKSNIDPLGLVSILYNNFKNIIKIQLGKNPTSESCGLKSNQFWAIKNNNIGFYSKEELINIFLLLTDIDRKVRTGEICVDQIIDYLLINIL